MENNVDPYQMASRSGSTLFYREYIKDNSTMVNFGWNPNTIFSGFIACV